MAEFSRNAANREEAILEMLLLDKRMAELSRDASNSAAAQQTAAAASSAFARGAVDPPLRRARAAASAGFALALYQELAGETGNIIFAPASINAALAMAWLGAKGETATELSRALHLPKEPEALRATLLSLSSQATDAPGCELSIANAIWIQKSYPLLSEYLESVREQFGTTVEQGDFVREADAIRRAINAWVVAQTRGHVRDVIGPGTLNAITRLVLVNAVYFKGAWASPFKPLLTRPQPFHRPNKRPIEVPLMFRTASYRLLDDGELQVLELPYRGAELSMVVLLPREVDGLRHFERMLDARRLQQVFEQLEDARFSQVEVYLPRFRIEASYRVNDALKQLGARHAFDERADFSGMTADPEGLYIAAVLHKAFVEVGEEGTVAAAATVGRARATAPLRKLPPSVFRADRPFLFAIRHAWSGMILFLGRLVDPAE